MKAKDIIKRLLKEGWFLDRQESSHQTYKHPDKKEAIVISAHRPSQDVSPGLLNDIKRKAGW